MCVCKSIMRGEEGGEGRGRGEGEGFVVGVGQNSPPFNNFDVRRMVYD